MPAVDTPNAQAAASDITIDLPLFDISSDQPQLGRRLVEAAARSGFLWIVGSPASDELKGTYPLNEKDVDNMFAISKEFFFQTPPEEKARCALKDNKGYLGMHQENLDPAKHRRGDFKEAFNLVEAVNDKWSQPMPETLLRHEDELKDFQARCRQIQNRLFELLAEGLELPEPKWLSKRHTCDNLRLLYYPELPPNTDYSQQSDIRAGAHSDYGSLTLLFQKASQPGLEIQLPDGTWAAVPIFPPNYHSTTFPPIVVNVGDLLENWTNGLLRSTIHRVILPGPEKADEYNAEARFSIAVFIDADPDVSLGSMPSPIVAARAAAFSQQQVGHGGGIGNAEVLRTMTAGEYLENRLKATYGAFYKPTSGIAL
ncbi:putative oxidoreductase, 2OG-Fe(II) oxygenase family [Penicillium brasilianum]|uniref:Putative oxidoreductase, 2OG-Fe(II) oxygenase family n=1 Tax=Penicillium brasilianum TaxID=104259 RepID=A0A1S9RFC2_PENBI|nr:putative oxidoreductase, 2OG-Fe(II) oxygenase family [Penicillium brasilianum]